MMRRLLAAELIHYEKYLGIRLTKKGIEVAKSIHERHSTVSKSLMLIGVDEDIDYRDVEEEI